MPEAADYSIQAIVIPRGYDPKTRRLRFCLSFGPIPPPPPKPDKPGDIPKQPAPVIPTVLGRWPKKIAEWLATARLKFDSDDHEWKSVSFELETPADLPPDWSADWSQHVWSSLFSEVNFGKDDPGWEKTDWKPQKIETAYRNPVENPDKSKMPLANLEVNPEAASALNPAIQFESPNPVAISHGLLAEQYRSVRAENPNLRKELDTRYVAALNPDAFRRSFLAFAGKVGRDPDRFPATVAAVLPALVGLIADGAAGSAAAATG
ncbi:MAG TPA: hypothetical protein VH120_04840, partial [Gemmataceae bacterium]|nr:hypothetical protein [Gemmataceae bacterium]